MTAHAPIPDYAAARQAMVDSQLRPEGVSDPAVIAAMSLVPREQFVPDEQKLLAYIDRSVPLGEGRALPAPAVLGLLLTALAPVRGERALLVGAGRRSPAERHRDRRGPSGGRPSQGRALRHRPDRRVGGVHPRCTRPAA